MRPPCVVNFANGRWYPRGQARLMTALRCVGYTGSVLLFDDERSIGSPTHAECGYGFKLYSLLKARDLGYTKLLWVDSSVWPVKDIQPVFDHIQADGIFLLRGGNHLGEWSSDASLAEFSLSRDKAMAVPEATAALIGLDLDQAIGQTFLYELAEHIHLFHGATTNEHRQVSEDSRVKGHRNDQTVISLIANRHGIRLTEPRGYVAERNDFNEVDMSADPIFVLHRWA